VLLFAQAIFERSKLIEFLCQLTKRHTMLEELEAVNDAALVSSKQKTTTMLGLSRSSFFLGDFRSELYTSAHDPPAFNLGRFVTVGRRRSLEIIPRVSLANMGSEWASQLRVTLALKFEIIVSRYADTRISIYSLIIF